MSDHLLTRGGRKGDENRRRTVRILPAKHVQLYVPTCCMFYRVYVVPRPPRQHERQDLICCKLLFTTLRYLLPFFAFVSIVTWVYPEIVRVNTEKPSASCPPVVFDVETFAFFAGQARTPSSSCRVFPAAVSGDEGNGGLSLVLLSPTAVCGLLVEI